MSSDEASLTQMVRNEVYRLFIEKGSCPTKEAVARSLDLPIADVSTAYAQLAAAHMLVLQPETGEVLMASPLAALPSSFLVETGRGTASRQWYGNCIWDALGIISMIQSGGRVLTSCGCCGERMSIEVSGNRPVAQPTGIAHFAIPARRWWDDIVFN